MLPERGLGGLLDGLDGFDVNLDLQVVADEHATGLESYVPGEAPILAVDGRLGAEGLALATPRVLAATFEGGVEDYFLGRAADSEVAIDLIFVALDRLDALALKGDIGVIGYVEEVSRAQVAVAALFVGEEGVGVDAGLDV